MTKAQMIAALKAVVECSKIDAEKWHGDAYFDGKAAAYKEVLAMLDVYFDAHATSKAAEDTVTDGKYGEHEQSETYSTSRLLAEIQQRKFPDHYPAGVTLDDVRCATLFLKSIDDAVIDVTGIDNTAIQAAAKYLRWEDSVNALFGF